LTRGIESLWRVEGVGGSTTARSGGFRDGMDRREQRKLAAYPKTPQHNTEGAYKLQKGVKLGVIFFNWGTKLLQRQT